MSRIILREVGGTKLMALLLWLCLCTQHLSASLLVHVLIVSIRCNIALYVSVLETCLPCDAMRCMVFVIVILSVRLSVTLMHCVHMVRPTIMISSPYGSPIILVSGNITFISKFERGHPQRGRWMRVGWVWIGDFRPISRRISETVRDMTKVTIDH